ncbi:hypothetical protein [Microbispora sp. H13382]|uniref:hypothetical protein n=1 Tax=Microbispora sp. H13382 TaxID=2729112 RepID=UPI0015FFE3DB|nr:hypothetical protein [Microbispora sp. H13382]
MEEAEAIQLREVLSIARIAEYEARCDGQTMAALRLHCWNTEICAAFYGPLQYLEVALRSVLSRELMRLFQRADWWEDADLHFGAQRKISEARDQLRRQGRTATADQLENELPFGFWASLLGPGNNYDQRLWRTALHRAFPGYQGGRRELHRSLDHLRVLRNKIAHHCLIYHRHLQADHHTILQCLGYIDAGLAGWVDRYSRVPGVLACRP